jgi:hypothetical protein
LSSTKPKGHPSDLSAKLDVNLSIHPASQQSGTCHAHLDELGHGNVGEVESSYSI